MSDIVALGSGRGSYLATVELYRDANGKIEAVLIDMPDHVIEGQVTVHNRFFQLAEWTMWAGLSFMRQGCAFDPETRNSKNDNA